VKRLSTLFALTALGAATVGLAQQSYQTPQQQPPPSSSQQSAPSQADKQALMQDCLAKVQAANPQASKDDVKTYCDKKVQEYMSPQKE
jgi:glucose/arabinose dehydrogenase